MDLPLLDTVERQADRLDAAAKDLGGKIEAVADRQAAKLDSVADHLGKKLDEVLTIKVDVSVLRTEVANLTKEIGSLKENLDKVRMWMYGVIGVLAFLTVAATLLVRWLPPVVSTTPPPVAQQTAPAVPLAAIK